MKEIKEIINTLTEITALELGSLAIARNHRKCLRHRLRTDERSDYFFYFLHFCGTYKIIRMELKSVISVISV